MTDEVEKWLESLPEESIEAELEELRNQVSGINRAIEIREQALAMKRTFANERLDPRRGNWPVRQTRVFEASAPFRGRDAVRQVIRETPEKRTWTISEMLEAILKRGWAGNTHSVQVNLSRMYRDGELDRESVGVYAVPEELRVSPEEARG
ncbi:MAG TPA: hypothetical protein VG448_08880 [Solirubrobacterales bacterium]|nr:hypothetical protein [Solirubrobacterales bacterium]